MRLLLWPFLALALLSPAAPATGAEDDPCTFHRVQARGKGLNHYTTEILWACEALAAREAAGLPLTERMQAVGYAIDQYKDAVIASRRHPAPAVPGRSAREVREMTRIRIAEDTGMLAALEAVRSGF